MRELVDGQSIWMRYTPLHILLVEDNAAEAELMKEALRTNASPCRLTTASTGSQALDFLFRPGSQSRVSRPDIIVLDLKLGGENGHDILKQLKSDPRTHCIPVIVLTSSEAEADVQEAYDAFANCYITKPFEVESFMKVVGKVENFWANVAVLPDC